MGVRRSGGWANREGASAQISLPFLDNEYIRRLFD